MSNPTDDKAFEEYLSRGSQISRRYRELGDDAVPPHLDQLVLTQARAAVARKDAAPSDELALVRNKRRRLMQWSVPAALAASAVLVISIVIRSGVQDEVMLVQDAPVKAEAPAAANAAAGQAQQQPDAQSANGVVLIAPPRDAATEFSSLAPRTPAEAARTRAEGSRVDAERAQAQSVAAHAKLAREQMQTSAVSSDMVPAPMLEPQVAAPPPAPAPPVIAATQSVSATTMRDAAYEQRSVAAQQTVQAERQAAQAKQSTAEQDFDVAEIAVTGTRRAPSTGAGPRGTITQSASAGDSLSDEEVEAVRLHADPQKWLEHIRQLRKEGKNRAADREWKQFREEYPDYAVAETDAARAR